MEKLSLQLALVLPGIPDEWRNGDDTPWLKDAPCHPLQQALNLRLLRFPDLQD